MFAPSMRLLGRVREWCVTLQLGDPLMQARLSLLILLLLALLLSASTAPARENSAPGEAGVSSRCEAAIDKVAGHYSRCLLEASAKYAKKENEKRLFARQAKCEVKFNAQVARARARFGEDRCTPYASEIADRTANYAQSVASEAHGLSSPSLPCVPNGAQQLCVATGSIGWEYNQIGKKICSKLNESDHFQCKAIVTRGSLQNIELLQDDKVNLALSQSDMIPEGSVDFVSLKTLSRQALYVFVRQGSGIHSIHDLMHKRINAGPIGSGLRGTMDNVLKATGIVPSKASDVTAAKEAKLLCRNQTDAISFILDLDAPQVEKIEKTCPMRRLVFSHDTLEEVMRSNATYYPIHLGSSGQEEAYAVGLYVDLVTYKDALSPEERQSIVDLLQAMP